MTFFSLYFLKSIVFIMKYYFLLFATFFYYSFSNAQNTFNGVIKDLKTGETVLGAKIELIDLNLKTIVDIEGIFQINNIPDGQHIITCVAFGYETWIDTLAFPFSNQSMYEITLMPITEGLEEIIIEGTRSNRSIAASPTRVEVLTEEIDEASTMDPSKVAHLLTHSTGIQVQQTSATNNTANVRIQGLDGRYAQILKDGFPIYGGFSGSLSIMQIPPLDLRQVEYIKGSASTLYGGGAISGLINLISKDPSKEENLVHINASHIGAFDVNVFTAKKINKIGYTLLAQRNSHQYFDADKDGFTDLPQLTKYNFNPKLFFYLNEKSKLSVGATFTNEIREGGDTKLLNNQLPDSVDFYKEKNDVNRITTQLKFDHTFNKKNIITFRNSFNFFKRSLELTSSPIDGIYRFAGNQFSTFSEFAFTNTIDKNVFIAGLNFYSDDFKEHKIYDIQLRNETFQTIGAFTQYTRDLGELISLEAGIRTDHVLNQKTYILPRLYTLFKWNSKFTSRIGGGLGYRNPTIFNQESELLGYRNILPIDKTKLKGEESYGLSADIGFKTKITENYFITFNQMFFYTYLKNPLVLKDTNGFSGIYAFGNSEGATQSVGAETFFKFGFYDFVLFVGYTYTHVTNTFNGISSEFTLTPKHSLKGDLLYALPNKWRIGADYEFKSSQLLSSGMRTKKYWTYGIVIERTINNFVFFANVENFTNFRQTNFGSLISAPNNTPQFTEVWAPLDGIVVNTGIKLKL